jgi:hypothetical protein
MSETPRTDAEVIQFGDGPAKYVYAAFADKLEREIRQLEVAIYDGKKEAGVLRQMLAEMHEVNAELHKDAQRLDWLLKTQSFLSINQLGTRKDIDKEME